MAVFKGHNSECDLQQDIMLFDVSWLMYIRFLVHMQKEEGKVNVAATAQHGINSVLGLSHMVSKFLVS